MSTKIVRFVNYLSAYSIQIILKFNTQIRLSAALRSRDRTAYLFHRRMISFCLYSLLTNFILSLHLCISRRFSSTPIYHFGDIGALLSHNQ